MSDWQPIDTIPRDGTKVLVSDGEGNYSAASFFKEEAWGIDFTFYHGGYGNDGLNPTHWMTLQQIPKGK